MASFADKATGPIKAKRLSSSQEEAMAGIFTSEKNGLKSVELDKKFNNDKKILNKKFPGESTKLIFGTPSEEYLSDLFSLYKKYNKTNSKTIEDFKKEI